MITTIQIESPVKSSTLFDSVTEAGGQALLAYCHQERLALNLGSLSTDPVGGLDHWLVSARAYTFNGSFILVTANVDRSAGTPVYVAIAPCCDEGFQFDASEFFNLMNEVRPRGQGRVVSDAGFTNWNRLGLFNQTPAQREVYFQPENNPYRSSSTDKYHE